MRYSSQDSSATERPLSLYISICGMIIGTGVVGLLILNELGFQVDDQLGWYFGPIKLVGLSLVFTFLLVVFVYRDADWICGKMVEAGNTIGFVVMWALTHHSLGIVFDALGVTILGAEMRFVLSFVVAATLLTSAYGLRVRLRD